jgi:predicted RNase H-like nuclease (RuvC/YqgF family)
MTAVFNNLSSLSNLAPAWGVKVEPVGLMRIPLASDTKKNEPASKWSVNLPQGAQYTEQAEDDVEALEEEVHSLKMQMEESQRTISKLEHSKTNLAELLKTERKKTWSMKKN